MPFGLCCVGVLDALGRVFKVCLLNCGFFMVVLFFFCLHVVVFSATFVFCHFGSGFFLPIPLFCEQHQLIERSKCRVYRKKYCIIMGYKALLFGFNHSFFLAVMDYNWHLFSWALTILLCLILEVGLHIRFHGFILVD